ncbi:MAG: hypothetical protein Q9190_000114 [Brigantiaea leucoxantha]
MQEWVRTYFDDYLEGLKDGQSASDASILSVRKDLNDLPSELYHQNATFTDAEEWMDKNEYHASIADKDIEKWTSQ